MNANYKFLKSDQTIFICIVDFKHFIKDDVRAYFEVRYAFGIRGSINGCPQFHWIILEFNRC